MFETRSSPSARTPATLNPLRTDAPKAARQLNENVSPHISRMVLLRILGILTALLFVAMVIHAAPLYPSIPTIHFTFSEASFNAVLAQWQPTGVARFKRHFAFDFPFLVSYGFFGYLLCKHTSLTLGLSTRVKSLLTWALPFAAAMDAVENLLHLTFIYAGKGIPAAFYFVAGIVATFKWAVIVAFVIGAGYTRVRNAG